MRNIRFVIIGFSLLWTSAQAATTTRYGDALLVNKSTLADDVGSTSVHLISTDGEMGLYVFCVDSRTPNVSIYLINGDFAQFGYRNGARVPVTWRADSRQPTLEQWEVIGRDDDLRRYGKLGLISAELFKTKSQFTLMVVEKTYIFPSRGIGTAMSKLKCVIPFLRSTGYIK